MASGKTHSIVALVLAGSIPLALYIYKVNVPLGPIAKGLLVGWAVTPDEDVDGQTHEEARLEQIPLIGPVLGYVWSCIWFPYARLIPHRSPFSHWPIIGTVGRFLYLWLWGRLILSLLGYNLPLKVDLWFLAGWAIQDAGHFVADYI